MTRAAIVVGTVLLLSSPATAQQRPAPDQVYQHPMLNVVVPDFPAEGLILDVGGGGEGIIGQVKGKQVVAIDLVKRELDDAPGNPLLKIVMDARELKFVDGSFATATVFFTFMYISPDDHAKVFAEIARVLKPGGRLLIWDAVFPKKADERQLYVLFPLTVKLPKTEVKTGYGVKFPGVPGAEHYATLAKAAGFDVVSRAEHDGWFALELKKRQP